MKNIVKKFFKSLFGSKDYNTGFAIVNQPCFDKNGKFLGWFSRSMATAIFVFARNKDGVLHVLASERGKGAADFQGCWNCPCGYLDFNETTKQCAIRELEEETGIWMNQIAAVGAQEHVVRTGEWMVGSGDDFGKAVEREVGRDDTCYPAAIRIEGYAVGGNGIVHVDGSLVEIAEGVNPAGLARLPGSLIPLLAEIIVVGIIRCDNGIAIVEGIDRKIASVLREHVGFRAY